MTATRFGIGQPAARVEDARLLRGEGRYTDDITLPGMLRGYVLRSSHAHARLLSVGIEAAARHPGVVAILTAQDYRGDGGAPIPCGVAGLRGPDGGPAFIPLRIPLAETKVRFVGDPIAFVIADTLDAARDAAEAIAVDYDPLSAVLDATAATRGHAAVWDERPDNTCFVHEAGDSAAVEATLARAAHVVQGRFVIPRVAVSPLEARGCVCAFDDARGTWRVETGVQDVFGARRALAAALNEPEARFDVISPDVGGSFGLKGVDPELVLTVWAARRLGRPVKWVADRSEAFISDNHGRDNVTEAALALDRDGTFLALRVRTSASLGAYPSYFGPAPPINNLGSLAGVYRTPAIAVRVTGVFTNANPTGPYRGAGRPEAAYVMERMADLAARALGLDRADIRRRNMIPPHAMPFKTALTFTYDVGDFAGVLDRALAAADYRVFAQRRDAARARGKLRGIGLAAVIERATIRGTSESVEVRIAPSGIALVLAGSTDQGQGHRTMYTQIVCDRLGLDPAAVKVVEADSRRLPNGGMTGSSRVSAMGSGATLKALAIVIEKARLIAAHALEVAPADLAVQGSRFMVVGTDRGIDLAEIARRAHEPSLLPPDLSPGLAARADHTAAAENFPNGVHVCELEIDPETGRTAIQRYVVVDDVGTMINPLIVHGQIHGGVAQGIGEALLEQVVHDPASGQPLSGSFMDYAMPRADDLCFLEVASHPVPTATNALGVKGAGEAGLVGALPAVIGGVVDALAPLGIAHIDMPATNERIWRAIRAAGGIDALKKPSRA